MIVVVEPVKGCGRAGMKATYRIDSLRELVLPTGETGLVPEAGIDGAVCCGKQAWPSDNLSGTPPKVR